MASQRTYTIPFRGVSVSAVQDLCAAYCGASMAIEIVSITIGQITQTTVENLNISIKHLPAAVSAGSGGGSVTPVADNPTDAAATFTARINDTSQATTGGTANYPHVDVFNEVNGYQWIFPERARPSAKLSEALVLSLDTAPGAARTMSGSIKIRELF
ncbi:MAG TPA: hypothetical protein VGR45_17295 [Stellaceae bacterium]|nr:hypothetical protein [Stellaceae bacterium]